jgi:hypothetical protein
MAAQGIRVIFLTSTRLGREMTTAHWFTQHERGGFAIERAPAVD